ncbi:M20/M25/M40 family metallo-hydrolase, partial [Streptomyces xiamenensis]
GAGGGGPPRPPPRPPPPPPPPPPAGAAAPPPPRDGVGVTVTEESRTGLVAFDTTLRDRLAALLTERLGGAPLLPTGAGHDAGILSATVPTAMLYVRNPTGISHAPTEHATEDDCEAGVTALAEVLEELVCR